MGLKQYKVGPRRVVVARSFEVQDDDGAIRDVMLADSAVEDDGVDGCDWKAYRDSLYDTGKLKFKDGDEPTYFAIKPLTPRQKHYIEDMSLNKKLRWAFRFSVTDITGFVVCDPDGGNQEELPPIQRKSVGTGLGDAITEGWVVAADIATDFLQAVGLMVIQISEATAPLSRESAQQSGAGS